MLFKQLKRIKNELELKHDYSLTDNQKELLSELKLLDELKYLDIEKVNESLSMGGNCCPTCKRAY